MPNHQRAAAHRTTLARQPGSISGETKLRAVDQPIATPELPSAVPLMALSTGFWAFKTLAAAHELDLFSRLAGGAGVTVAGLAEALGLHPRPAEMLLTGCAALGLLEKTDGRYRNTPLSEAYLVRGKPYYFGGFVQMADKRLYAGWGKLTEALRTNRPTTWDPAVQSSMFDGEDPTMLALFWEAMHSLSTMTARKLGEAMDLSHFRRLLDIGGGSGAYRLTARTTCESRAARAGHPCALAKAGVSSHTATSTPSTPTTAPPTRSLRYTPSRDGRRRRRVTPAA